jgi:hypothetical protein
MQLVLHGRKQIHLITRCAEPHHFCFGVIAASNCAGVILKSLSIEVGTTTGTPPESFTISK